MGARSETRVDVSQVFGCGIVVVVQVIVRFSFFDSVDTTETAEGNPGCLFFLPQLHNAYCRFLAACTFRLSSFLLAFKPILI